MAYVGHVGNQADKQATFRFKGTFFSLRRGCASRENSSCKRERIAMVWGTQVHPEEEKHLKFIL